MGSTLRLSTGTKWFGSDVEISAAAGEDYVLAVSALL